MCQFVVTAERAQDVAWLKAGRSTGGATGYGEFFHCHNQAFTFDEVEADVQVVRGAVFEVAVDIDFFDAFDAFEEDVAQFSVVCHVLLEFFFGDAEGFAHADDLVGRQGAAAEAAFVAAAVHLGFEADAGFAADVQGADAFGAVYFMTGHGKQVDFSGFDVDRHFAAGLGGIDVEDDFAFAADFADGGNILHDADFVVHPHHGNQDGVVADGGFEFFQINQTVFLHAEIGYFKTLAFEFAHGVEYGFVFGFDGDEVFAFGFVEVCRAFDGEVVGLGRAAGEDDFFGIGVNQGGDVGACFFNGLFRCPAECVAVGSGVAEGFGQIGNHFFGNAFVNGGGGGVVEINGGFDGHGLLFLFL